MGGVLTLIKRKKKKKKKKEEIIVGFWFLEVCTVGIW